MKMIGTNIKKEIKSYKVKNKKLEQGAKTIMLSPVAKPSLKVSPNSKRI